MKEGEEEKEEEEAREGKVVALAPRALAPPRGLVRVLVLVLVLGIVMVVVEVMKSRHASSTMRVTQGRSRCAAATTSCPARRHRSYSAGLYRPHQESSVVGRCGRPCRARRKKCHKMGLGSRIRMEQLAAEQLKDSRALSDRSVQDDRSAETPGPEHSTDQKTERGKDGPMQKEPTNFPQDCCAKAPGGADFPVPQSTP